MDLLFRHLRISHTSLGRIRSRVLRQLCLERDPVSPSQTTRAGSALKGFYTKIHGTGSPSGLPVFSSKAKQNLQLVFPEGVKWSWSKSRLGGALAQAWSLQPSHLCWSMNCYSVLVPLTPLHTLFSLVCSLVKDPSHFQLSKHFPWRVKCSLVLIGVSHHPPPSLPSTTFPAVGRTKKCRYYLTYYWHGTVIYDICLVKCHAENIYGPLQVLWGGGESNGCGGEASCSTLAKYSTVQRLPLPFDSRAVGSGVG